MLSIDQFKPADCPFTFTGDCFNWFAEPTMLKIPLKSFESWRFLHTGFFRGKISKHIQWFLANIPAGWLNTKCNFKIQTKAKNKYICIFLLLVFTSICILLRGLLWTFILCVRFYSKSLDNCWGHFVIARYSFHWLDFIHVQSFSAHQYGLGPREGKTSRILFSREGNMVCFKVFNEPIWSMRRVWTGGHVVGRSLQSYHQSDQNQPVSFTEVWGCQQTSKF